MLSHSRKHRPITIYLHVACTSNDGRHFAIQIAINNWRTCLRNKLLLCEIGPSVRKVLLLCDIVLQADRLWPYAIALSQIVLPNAIVIIYILTILIIIIIIAKMRELQNTNAAHRLIPFPFNMFADNQFSYTLLSSYTCIIPPSIVPHPTVSPKVPRPHQAHSVSERKSVGQENNVQLRPSTASASMWLHRISVTKCDKCRRRRTARDTWSRYTPCTRCWVTSWREVLTDGVAFVRLVWP